MKATHKNISQIVGDKQVQLQPGQFIFGRRKAAKEINMSERSIRTCLSFLKMHKNLTITSTHQYSIITICNWASYQNNGSKNDPQNDPRPTTNKNNIIILLRQMKIGRNDSNRYALIRHWKKSYDEKIIEDAITKAYEKYCAGKDISEGYIVAIMKKALQKEIPKFSGQKEPWEDG